MSQREELIREKIRAEQAAAMRDTDAIRRAMLDFLINFKGYRPEEVEADRIFEVGIGGRKETTSTDFVIRLEGRLFMAIKCAPSAIESRERHILSFSRVVGPIPFSLVTDGIDALYMDTATGKTLYTELNAIPSHDEALMLIEGDIFREYPAHRLDMEKRILFAFDGLGCPPVE